MATSGTVYSDYAKSSRLYVKWSRSSYSIENNTSTIKWTAGIVVSAGNKWYANAVKITSVKINGKTVSNGGTYSNLTSNGTYAKLSGTTTVAHDADGDKTFTVSISGWFYPDRSRSGSKSYALPNIPRATTPSFNKSSVALGSAVTINTVPAASSFTHTITYKFGDASGTIATKTGADSTSWTPPASLANEIPNAASGTATITVQTYSGTKLIGTKSKTLKLTVPITSSAYKPTISAVNVEEAVTSVTSAFGSRYVKLISQVLFEITASGVYGSTIASYKTVFDGVTYAGSSFTSNAIKTAGTLTATITVTDSRGATAQTTKTITVVDYEYPQIKSVDVDVSGNTATITVKGKVAPVANVNSKSLVVTYKKVTDTAWGTPKTIALSAYDFSGVGVQTTITGIDPTITYDIKATLTDKIDAITFQTATGITAISLKAGGTGATFGAEATVDGFVIANGWPFLIDDPELEALYNEVFGAGGGNT